MKALLNIDIICPGCGNILCWLRTSQTNKAERVVECTNINCIYCHILYKLKIPTIDLTEVLS